MPRLINVSELEAADAVGQGFLSGMNRFYEAKDRARKERYDEEDRQYRQMELESKLKAQDDARKHQDFLHEAELDRQKKDRFMAALNRRKSGFLSAKSGDPYDTEGLEYDPQYLAMKRDQMNADPYGLKAMAAKKAGDEAQFGQRLPPDKVLAVQEGANIPGMLSELEGELSSKKELFGPVMGRIGENNPYDTESQATDAKFRAASQAFGRFMEGGVLRKEDEEKYRKMFPQLRDTPDVAAEKLAIVQNLLAKKQNANVSALKAQGYDTRGFNEIPVAGFLNKNQRTGLVNKFKDDDGLLNSSAKAAEPTKQDSEAVAWAKKNPNDPRAKKILEINGVK